MSEAEHCCVCGEETGKAGIGEDSLYCDGCEKGPFCSDCEADHHNADLLLDKLLNAVPERRFLYQSYSDELGTAWICHGCGEDGPSESRGVPQIDHDPNCPIAFFEKTIADIKEVFG